MNAYYNNSTNAAFKYAIELFHHSTNSSPIAFQRTAKSAVNLTATYLTSQAKWSGGVRYTNSIYRPYGVPLNSSIGITKNDKWMYHIIEPTIKVAKLNADQGTALNYESTIDPYVLIKNDSAAHQLSENGLNWNTHLDKAWEGGHQAVLNFLVQYNQLKTELKNWSDTGLTPAKGYFEIQKNMLLHINPAYQYKAKDWYAHVGVNVVMDQSTLHLAPDVQVGKNLITEYLMGYAGWKGDVRKNSYYSMQQINPFVDYLFLQNTVYNDVFIGLKGTDKKNLTYNLKLALVSSKQLPFFVNTDSADFRGFTLAYQNGKATMFNVHAEAGYNAKDQLKINAAIDYTNYYAPDYFYNYHQPTFTAALNAAYKLNEQWQFKLGGMGWNNFLAKSGNTTTTIKGAADINLEASYQYNKFIAAYVQLNNLTNTKYQRWYGYPVYGLNGMIGVVLNY